MWSGISNYLFKSEQELEENEFIFNAVEDIEDDWLFIDVRDLKSKEHIKIENEAPPYLLLPDVVLQTNDTKQKSSPAISSDMDESWYITPPSCFTIDSPVPLETSPLENLLIEHPSMSVYGSKLPSSFKTYFCQNIKMKSNRKDETENNLKNEKLYSKLPNEESCCQIKQRTSFISNKIRTAQIHL